MIKKFNEVAFSLTEGEISDPFETEYGFFIIYLEKIRGQEYDIRTILLRPKINNKEIEDFVLNDRIEGTKKFKVNATPTIIINNKKFEKSLNYKNLKKSLEKLI